MSEEATAGGGAASRAGRWWGLLCSLAWHGLVVGLVVALGTTAGPRRTDAPAVILDVVFGVPAGDGGPGDGAAGAPGTAGVPAEAAASPPPVAEARPEPPVARPVPPPSPVRAPAKPTRHPRPVPPKSQEPPSRSRTASEASRPSPPASPVAAGDATGTETGGTGAAGGPPGQAGPGRGGQGSGPGGGGHGGGSYEGAFGAGGGPTFAHQVRPQYPAQARRFGRQGVVVLWLCIDAAGQLTQAEVVEKAGAGFDEAALASVRASSYRPAQRDGRPVPSRAVLRIRFQLAGM